MEKNKILAASLKYDEKDVLVKYAKYDVDGNSITDTYSKIKNTQPPLLSGYNIKTINGQSILGSGDLTINSLGQADFASVAFSGSYLDLTNRPAIPTAISQLSNDVGYLTSIDWDHVTNKPEIPEALVSGTTIKTINGESLLGEGNITITSNNTQVPTNISAFTNDAGYLTEHQSLSGYATEQWVGQQGYLTEHQSLSNYALLNTTQSFTELQTFNQGIKLGNVNGSIKLYQDGSGFFRVGLGSDDFLKIGPDLIWPLTDDSIDIGGDEHRIKDIYLSGEIKDGTHTFTLPSSTGTLALQSELLLPTQFYYEYSNTSSYKVGDYRTHDGKFYVCKTAISYPGEEWNAEHWIETKYSTHVIGLTSNSLFGVSLNDTAAAKANNPECSMYWNRGSGVITSYSRNTSDDTYTYFQNLSIDGNTLTKDVIRVKKENGNMYQYTETAGLLPAAPTTDGTYTLQVVVSNGTPTYSWVLKS